MPVVITGIYFARIEVTRANYIEKSVPIPEEIPVPIKIFQSFIGAGSGVIKETGPELLHNAIKYREMIK